MSTIDVGVQFVTYEAPKPTPRPSPLSVVQSVLGAAIGIQTEKKRQEDFKHGKPGDYILFGVLFVIVFVITLVLIVNHVISSAGL